MKTTVPGVWNKDQNPFLSARGKHSEDDPFMDISPQTSEITIKTLYFESIIGGNLATQEIMPSLLPPECFDQNCPEVSTVIANVNRPSLFWDKFTPRLNIFEELIGEFAQRKGLLPEAVAIKVGIFGLRGSEMIPVFPKETPKKLPHFYPFEACSSFSLKELIDDPGLIQKMGVALVPQDYGLAKKEPFAFGLHFLDISCSKSRYRRSFSLLDFWNIHAEPKGWEILPEVQKATRSLTGDFLKSNFDSFLSTDLGHWAARIVGRDSKVRFLINIINSTAHEGKNARIFEFFGPQMKSSRRYSFENVMLRRIINHKRTLDLPNDSRYGLGGDLEDLVDKCLKDRYPQGGRARDTSRDQRKSYAEPTKFGRNPPTCDQFVQIILKPDESQDSLTEQNKRLVEALYDLRKKMVEERKEADDIIQALESKVKYLKVAKSMGK
jgi:hypothetical protein